MRNGTPPLTCLLLGLAPEDQRYSAAFDVIKMNEIRDGRSVEYGLEYFEKET